MASISKNLGDVWQRTSLMQRVVLLGILLGGLAAGWFVVDWARRPSLAMLYSRLSPQEASRIVEKLRDAGVAYELKEGGTTIYADEGKIYALRLNMASEGLPAGEQAGYRILDDEKIGASPFTQHVNYIRAVEGELAKSIQVIDGVISARVHVAKPEGSLFIAAKKQASATVVLRVKADRRLSGANVAAIVHLLSGSVEGLSPEKVVVVDAQGSLLSGNESELGKGVDNILEYKARVEQYLAQKVEVMLSKVLGAQKVSVEVDAVLETSRLSSTKETYDPTNKVISKEKTRSSSGGAASGPSGGGKEEEIESTYMVSKTVDEKTDLPGNIKSISVAAFVDLSAPAKAGAAGAAPTQLAVKDIEDMIRSAVGLRPQDTMKVVNVPFQAAAVQPAEAAQPEGFFNKDFLLEIAKRASLGILVIGVLLMLRIFSRPRVKSGAATPALAGAAGSGNLLPGDRGEVDPDRLRVHITRALRENPDEVKRLFLAWVDSEKERA
jgi:flagellar M-ring protein FliF